LPKRLRLSEAESKRQENGGKPMVIVSVIYPANEGARFDVDYYLKTHVPMVGARAKDGGLREVKVLRGSSAPGGGAPAYSMIALLSFDSAAAFEQVLERHGAEIIGDIPNFSNVQPVIQINDVLI
jgi:uncharacterized protein (TIGR02118 family)